MSDFPMLPQSRSPTVERILKDYSNPYSLINLVPPDFKKVIEALPDEYLNMPEDEVEKLFPDPSPTVSQIRTLFWLEYDRAVECRVKMDLPRVHLGCCTRETFLKLLRTPSALIWILTPPPEYMAQVGELLTYALKQVREILAMPLKNSMGFVDSKMADTKLRAAMMLDMRLKGGYVQRSMQITQNINENRYTKVSTEEVTNLDDEIKRLEAELAQQHGHTALPNIVPQQLQRQAVKSHPPEAIEADFVEVDEGKRPSHEEGDGGV